MSVRVALSQPDTPLEAPLFSKIESYLLPLFLVFSMVILQQIGLYVSAMLLLDSSFVNTDYMSTKNALKTVPPHSATELSATEFSATELMIWGGQNGTVVSLSLIFTMMTMLGMIVYLVVRKVRRQIQQQNCALVANLSVQSLPDPSTTAAFIGTSTQIPKINRTCRTLRFLAVTPLTLSLTLKMIALLVGYSIVADLSLYLLDKDASAFMDGLYATASPKWLLILAVTVIVPIYEELMFRGMMWSALRENFTGKRGFWLVNIVTSALFVVIHVQYDVFELSLLFVFALLLGYSRARSGSILMPILLHMLNNMNAMLLYIIAV